MSVLHLDFETFSSVDLAKCGVDVYFEHPSTGYWCYAFAFDDEAPEVRAYEDDIPERIVDHIVEMGQVWAHNSRFERTLVNTIGRYRGWPHLEIAQTHCTMAAAHAMGLPGGLGRAASALGIAERKDDEGRRIMLELAQPDRHGSFLTPDLAPEKHRRLREYCKQDVVVEREVGRRLVKLPPRERLLWELDQEINDRGIGIDRTAVRAALVLARAEEERLNIRMNQLTGLNTTQNVKLLAWLNERGCPVKSLAKADIIAALAEVGDRPDTVMGPLGSAWQCVEVLEVRQESAKASNKKLTPMIVGASADGRIRGTRNYHGAFTGRPTGRRVQLYNLPRSSTPYPILEWLLEKPQERLTAQVTGLFDRPLNVLSDALRPMFAAAPGHEFVSADLSQIEARVLPWLAGEEWVLEAFRSGEDIYCTEATAILRLLGMRQEPVTKADSKLRQDYGKIPTLACGYQGGWKSFVTMGKTYGSVIPPKQARVIVKGWRAAHPKVKAFWGRLEECAIAAVMNPRTMHRAGRIGYFTSGSWLICQLPDGKRIYYPHPKVQALPFTYEDEDGIERTVVKDTLTYQSAHEEDGGWGRTRSYGGKLCENVTQATAFQFFSMGLLRVAAAGHKIVLDVYDEVVIEAPIGSLNPEDLCSFMTAGELWTEGLPVAASGWAGPRYRK